MDNFIKSHRIKQSRANINIMNNQVVNKTTESTIRTRNFVLNQNSEKLDGERSSQPVNMFDLSLHEVKGKDLIASATFAPNSIIASTNEEAVEY